MKILCLFCDSRNREMKERVESLISELDNLSGKVHGQTMQSAQTIKDFFKAHRY